MSDDSKSLSPSEKQKIEKEVETALPMLNDTAKETPKESGIPEVVKVTKTDKYQKEDPPLLDIKITNPVTYLKLFLRRLLQNEGIDIKVRIRPLTAIAMFLAFATFFAGTGFSVAQLFFPNSSPILKRQVTFEGIVKRTDNGAYYLSLSDNQLYRLQPKTSADYRQYINKEVLVKGNLTKEPNVIDVTGIDVFENQ